jgi:hypothetical protein
MSERFVWRLGAGGLLISAMGLVVFALQLLLITGLALGGLSVRPAA